MIVKTLGHNSTSFLVNFFHIQKQNKFSSATNTTPIYDEYINSQDFELCSHGNLESTHKWNTTSSLE